MSVRTVKNTKTGCIYTEAFCNDCERACPESHAEGGTGRGPKRDSVCTGAHEAAKAAGWHEVLEPLRTPTGRLSRKAVWSVLLLCPECKAKREDAR